MSQSRTWDAKEPHAVPEPHFADLWPSLFKDFASGSLEVRTEQHLPKKLCIFSDKLTKLFVPKLSINLSKWTDKIEENKIQVEIVEKTVTINF